MHFRIERERGQAGGLRVLGEIPHHNPGLLEGPNGIGKTLAVHLLQLVAGAQPFLPTPALWTSLRGTLGPTTVTVAGLAGGQELRVRLEPELWPAEVAEFPGDRLGQAWLGGQEIPATEAAALLSVVRIAGTETPDETVVRAMRETRTRVAAAAAAANPRLAAVRDALAPLRGALRDIDPERATHLASSRAQMAERVERADHEADEARRRAALTASALAARAALGAHASDRRELQDRLDEVERNLAHARKERDRVATEVNAARDALVRSGVVAERLAKAEQTLQARLRRLSNRQEEAEQALRDAGEPPDVDAELRVVAVELATIAAERSDLDTSERTERLVGELVAAVELARREGIADNQIVARLDGRPIEARALAEALRERAAELAGRPVPGVLEQLDARRASVAARRDRLLVARDRLATRKRQQELVDEQRLEVERLRAQAGGDIAQRLHEQMATLAGHDERLLAFAREAVDLRARLGELGRVSAADAQADLDAGLAELGVDADGLDDVAVAAEREVDRALVELAAAREALADVDRELRIGTLAEQRAAEQLRNHPELLAVAGIDTGTNGDAAAKALVGRLAVAVARVDARLTGAENALGALVDVAESVANRRVGGDRLFAETFADAAGDRLRRELDTPSIRKALFDGNPLARIDLRQRVAFWVGPKGEPRDRPLEAFSTGEQAFAFTQARIRELRSPVEPDRLLVLDEFGAFVSADRMRALAEFLAGDEVRAVASHVLVILPQQADYARQLDETRGELHRRVKQRVQQLHEQGYIAMPLSEAL